MENRALIVVNKILSNLEFTMNKKFASQKLKETLKIFYCGHPRQNKLMAKLKEKNRRLIKFKGIYKI